MSRIAKTPVNVPAGVDVAIGAGELSVKGPRGELRMHVHASVDVVSEDGVVRCRPKDGLAGAVAQAGTARSLIANMVTGDGDRP